VPQTFREVTNSLPLLLDSLEHIQQDLDDGEVDQNTEAALLPVIQDCTGQIKSLNQILKGTLPAPGDSQWKTATKALTSFWQDKKIQRIRATITAYQGPLLLFQTRRSKTSDVALEHQRLSIPHTIGGSESGDSSYTDYGTVMLSADRIREQFTSYSLVTSPISTTPSFGSPTEKIFEPDWIIRTESITPTALNSPNSAASEHKPRQSEPMTVERPSNNLPLIHSEPAIDPLQRTIEAKM
jgi:hypothetical protein